MAHLWLQIAVNDTVMSQDCQSLQDLHCESPDKSGREAIKAVGFDELV